MNCKNYLIERLKGFSRSDILFTDHARVRIWQRQIAEDEIIENILNPVRLYYALEESLDKFDCYFDYSKTLCHRYIILIKNKIIVVTVVKINRKWQSHLEKRVKHD